MRSLAVGTGPRIPRVAVVRGGRIVAEHLVRDESDVTIGTSEHARIMVRGASNLPSSFALLERVGDRYWLRFTEDMTGRVTAPNETGIATLADLRLRAHAVGDAYRIPLTDDARGKVVVGDTTFLFQLVPRPPVSPQPQLPLGVKNGLAGGFDWSLTIIAAFSFLIHFGVAGGMYSDWMDPVVAVDRPVLGIIDDIARLPRPAPEPMTRPQPEQAASDEPTTSSPPAPTPHQKVGPSRPSATPSPRSMTESEAARLAEKAEAMEVGMLVSKSNGPSVQKTLDHTNVPLVDLSRAAEKNTAVTHESTGDLKVATGGPVQQGRSKLEAIGGPTTKKAQDTAGPEGGPAGPSFRVDTQPPVMTAPISDADRVIAGLRPRFRKCYQDGLNQDPSMSGKAVIIAKVGPNGEVLSADVGSSQGLSNAVTTCLAKVVHNAEFRGNGSVTTLNVPITVLQQK